MPNYPKIVAILKKEFPDITSEEIDDMISKIPPNMPTVAIVPLIKLTKVCCKSPEKLQKLKNTSAEEVLKTSQKYSVEKGKKNE